MLLEDLPSLYGIGDTQELNRFCNVLAFNSGNEASLEDLSKHVGITKAKGWSQWLHSAEVSRSLHYARWKAGRQDLEVDIVSLDHRTQKPRFVVDGITIEFTPVALHCYTIARNLLSGG